MCLVFMAPTELAPVANAAFLPEMVPPQMVLASETSGFHLELVEFSLLHTSYCNEASRFQLLQLHQDFSLNF